MKEGGSDLEIQRVCLTCGKELSGKRRKFCSGKCADKYKPNVCVDCGKSTGRKSIRCISCALRNRPKQLKRSKRKYECSSCGVEVSKKNGQCRSCAAKRPWPSRKEFHDVAMEKGIEWLGPWTGLSKKTWWKCENGHTWEATFGWIRRTRHNGCRKCYNLQMRYNPDAYHVLAEQLGYKWLGPEVPNSVTKTSWECSAGHVWQSAYNWIQQGRGCPHCNKLYPPTKISIEDYHTLATRRSISWIGETLPEYTTVKTLWKCAFGHIIEESYQRVKARKKVCRQCNLCIDCGDLIPVGLRKCEKCKIEYLQRTGGQCIGDCGKMMSAPGMICLSCRNKRDWRDDSYRAQMTGETAPRWAGGLSLSPYGPGWTGELKEGIRERDNHICIICREWGNHVHHINYDKADHRPKNLITLCCSCHIKTNANREYWESVLFPIAIGREKQKGELTQIHSPEFIKVSNTRTDKHACTISYSLPVSGQSIQIPLSAPFLHNGVIVKKCPKCTWVKPYNKSFFKKRNQRLSHWCKECVAYYDGPSPAGEIDLDTILLPWSMHIDVTRKQANYIWN